MNEIGDEGARALSDALKTNTTLQELNLHSEQDESEEDGWIADIANNYNLQIGSRIGDEGARALSEALKINTTLQSLNLSCEKDQSVKDEWMAHFARNKHQQTNR